MKEEVILIFDIGKTNKKVILFDRYLKVLHEEETRFDEIVDDEGFPCDDAAQLESWVEKAIMNHSRSEKIYTQGGQFCNIRCITGIPGLYGVVLLRFITT